VEMWKSRRWRFPSAVGNDGKPPFGFPRFPRCGISIGLSPRTQPPWFASFSART
jgi:hypothetical protein